MIFRKTGVVTAVCVAAAVLTTPSAVARAQNPVDWQPCPEAPADYQGRCASVSVPVDWRDPGSSTRTDIGVARVPAAKPERRIGTLMFNPGGPGESAAVIVSRPDALRMYFPQELLDRFDIVGVDVRATGNSTPLKCSLPPRDPEVTRFPATTAETFRLMRSNGEFGASCLAGSGGLLANLDTGTVARDLDHVRAALGEDEISFLGMSYGTMLAQSYAELFPNRVRALVLDGVVDRSASWREMVEANARAVEDGFAQFAKWCADKADCGDAYRMIEDVLGRADAGGLSYQGRTVRAEEITMAVNAFLNTNLAFPALAAGLRAARTTGDAAPLLREVTINDPARQAAYRAILCQDVPVPAADVATLPEEARRVREIGPTLRGASEFWDIVTSCPGWPVPARWRPHGWTVPPEFPKALLLAGAHDVATPAEWARRVHRQLPGSALVRWEGAGHTAWLLHRTPEIERTVVGYLTTLDLPGR